MFTSVKSTRTPLSETLFRSLRHARAVLETWPRDYNDQRPHSKLGWMTPQAFALTLHGDDAGGAALRRGSAPRLLSHHQTLDQITAGLSLRLDGKRRSRHCLRYLNVVRDLC